MYKGAYLALARGSLVISGSKFGEKLFGLGRARSCLERVAKVLSEARVMQTRAIVEDFAKFAGAVLTCCRWWALA